MSAIHEIEKTILALPVEQRVFLAELLLGSLPPAEREWSDAEELADGIRVTLVRHHRRHPDFGQSGN